MMRLTESIKVISQDIDLSTKDTLVYGTRNVANWISVEGYHNVMAIITRQAGTGNVRKAALMVASTVTGTGATQVTATSGSTKATGLPNAAAGSNDGAGRRGVGMVVLETNVNDLDATLTGGKYVQVKVAATTATDEFNVYFILSNPRYRTADLTSTGNG